MKTLQQVFDDHLPAVLAARDIDSDRVVGFASSSGPELGYWVVSLADKTCRRGNQSDRPDVLIEADSRVLALMFAGGLDVARTIELGHIRVSGNPAALEALAELD